MEKRGAAGPEQRQRVAAFDIDGTVFRSTLALELVEALVEQRVFPPEAAGFYEQEREQWLDRKGDYATYVKKVVVSLATHLKGIDYQTVANIAGEVIESRRDRVYRYTRDLVKDLKAQGYYLLAISHSPKFIVDGFAFEHGFDKSYGTFYATGPSDKFTGTIDDEELIMNKGAVLTRAVRKEELTLEGSVAVGDTDSDIPMLEMVERPIAFNPNRELYEHAKRRQWEIVVERKDVIYEL